MNSNRVFFSLRWPFPYKKRQKMVFLCLFFFSGWNIIKHERLEHQFPAIPIIPSLVKLQEYEVAEMDWELFATLCSTIPFPCIYIFVYNNLYINTCGLGKRTVFIMKPRLRSLEKYGVKFRDGLKEESSSCSTPFPSPLRRGPEIFSAKAWLMRQEYIFSTYVPSIFSYLCHNVLPRGSRRCQMKKEQASYM